MFKSPESYILMHSGKIYYNYCAINPVYKPLGISSLINSGHSSFVLYSYYFIYNYFSPSNLDCKGTIFFLILSSDVTAKVVVFDALYTLLYAK